MEEPVPLVAVTATRIVLPTSAATSVYVLSVAPLIGLQLAAGAVAALPLVGVAGRAARPAAVVASAV